MNASELLGAAKLLIGVPKEQSFCERCGAVYEEDEQQFDIETETFSHRCDIEASTSAFMRASWRHLISGASPKSRARGYGVR